MTRKKSVYAAVQCGNCGSVLRGAPVEAPDVYEEKQAKEAMRVSAQELLRKYGDRNTPPACPHCGCCIFSPGMQLALVFDDGKSN